MRSPATRWLAPPLALGLALGAAVAGLFACLPDLEVVRVSADSGSDGGGSICGDGRIDPDAGEECDPGSGAAVGCAKCKLTCDDDAGLDPTSGHCYFEAVGIAQFSEADQTKCGAAGAHVVTFVSHEELAFVTGHVVDVAPFWVNLVRSPANSHYAPTVPFEPGFTFACPGCYAEVDAAATAFPVRVPKQTGACVIAQQDASASWQQSPCAGTPAAPTTWAVICEREPSGSRSARCGDGVCITIPRTFSAKRYAYFATSASASDAAATCASQVQGTLVLLDSPEEREQITREIAIQTIAPTGPGAEIWIGLARQNGGPWLWDDAKTRPQPWGLAGDVAEPVNAPVQARAFLRIQTGAADSELAHPGNTSDTRPFLCQY